MTGWERQIARRLVDQGRRELARRYGVHPATICLIQKGKTWKTR